MKRLAAFLAGTAIVAGCQDSQAPTAESPSAQAPVLSMAPQQGPLADQYIVVFKPSVTDVDGEIDRAAAAAGAQVHYRYYSAIKGFAATLPAPALEGLSRNPNVEFIEADGEMTADALTTQAGATWGLDRVDQRSGTDSYYTYDPASDGSGVTAYIIDTGIRLDHNDFEGRAQTGFDAVTSGGDASDCNGHGTHVAGTVGGATYGVAKAVTLVAVRVLNCRGSGKTSGVIAGIDWVTANASLPAVANMSLGGGASTALDKAVNNSVAAGVTYAVAAGNDNANACNYSPARAASAITVGATTSSDSRASYSNYGTCLDIFAPGSSITSDWYTSATATNTINGTSMASPHVAGAAALYLSVSGNSGKTPEAVTTALLAQATKCVVSNAGAGSPNKLLYTLAGSDDTICGSGGSSATPVHPASFSASSETGKRNWKATIETTVHDDDADGGYAGVVVTVGYTGGSQTWTCTTGSNGTCAVNVTISNSLSSVTFTLKGLSGTGSWNGSSDPDDLGLPLEATVSR
jgi:subtilisin family serine protease